MIPVTSNQFSEPLSRIVQKASTLNWKPVYLIPSSIEFFALSVVALVFLLLWPYGVFPIIASFLWKLIEDSFEEIKGKSFSTAMPYTVSIGIYFLIWLPFFIICFPCYLIGFIGKWLTGFEPFDK
jgi:hypothetical protein